MLEIWRDASLPLAERRRRIFGLWDECDEPPAIRSPADELSRARFDPYASPEPVSPAVDPP